jgi:hypothetical protein
MQPGILRPDEAPNPGQLTTHTAGRSRRGAGQRRTTRFVLAALCAIALAALVPVVTVSAKPLEMSNVSTQTAKLTTVAQFPVGYFLENVAVRADGSMLVTAMNKKELWYIPAPTQGAPVQPLLLHTFDQPPYDMVEPEPNVFYIDTSNYLTNHDSSLQRIDLRHWESGMPVPVQTVLKFPSPVSWLNGTVLLSPHVIAVADSGAGLIWRVDLSADGSKATARVWLKDPSMGPTRSSLLIKPPQPGVNGVKYDNQTHYLYYTSTARRLVMRVQVDPTTLGPIGAPELVASGHQWDDFALDEQAGVAYTTTHRENTIERVPLNPHSAQVIQTVAGIPFDQQLIGPSAFVWGRGRNDDGCVAYVTTDGGVTAPPPDGIVRPAKLLRADLCDTGRETRPSTTYTPDH